MKIKHDVPQILQNPELPNGCEITSLCQLLHYYGSPADKCDLADNYLPQSQFWYGADPDLVYLGNPRLDDNTPETGYYCFAGPVIQAADRYLEEHGSSLRAKDLTGACQEDLVRTLQEGHPFIFWATLRFGDIQYDPAEAWTLPDGRIHKPLYTLHCMVCCGIDEDSFLITDPLDLNTKVECSQFMKIFKQLGSRAVILEPRDPGVFV